MHVIAGLPRSGSTLLCNILNQNPDFYASSTSILPAMVAGLNRLWSESIEVKELLRRDQEETEDVLETIHKNIASTWYRKYEGKTIFDKSRGWNNLVLQHKHLYPNSKFIVCLRDLREVFASIEKQHRKQPIFDMVQKPEMKPLQQRAQVFFSPQGMIGSCLRGIKDMIDRRQDVYFLRYEELAEFPNQSLQILYAYLEIENFYDHDFECVENTAEDGDYLYLNKYPHRGEGQVKKKPSEWRKFMSPDLAREIMDGFSWYNAVFGYGGKRLKPIKNVPII